LFAEANNATTKRLSWANSIESVSAPSPIDQTRFAYCNMAATKPSSIPTIHYEDQVCLDSGASDHMTGDKSKLTGISPVSYG
jgi:hypothetical protein